MTDTFYALTRVDCNLRDDGINAQFTLTLAQSNPARFYVNPEGFGALIRSLKSAAMDMAKRLNASGQGAKYSAGGFENEADMHRVPVGPCRNCGTKVPYFGRGDPRRRRARGMAPAINSDPVRVNSQPAPSRKCHLQRRVYLTVHYDLVWNPIGVGNAG